MIWNFTPEEFATLTIEEAVAQAIGGASVCWSNPEDAGRFLEDKAMEVARALTAFIDSRAGEERPLLGLATTRVLLNELQCRGEISAIAEDDIEIANAAGHLRLEAHDLLMRLPPKLLDYRTVGSV